MLLLQKMLGKRKFSVFAAVIVSGLAAVATLWWNYQLSHIINKVSIGIAPARDIVLLILITALIIGAANYAKGHMAGYACEFMTHDLQMGYARFFSSLPFDKTEKLNTGEQLSKLQNEITGVSGYLKSDLFQLVDDSVRFFSTFIWLLIISPTLTITSNLPVITIVIYAFFSSKVISLATDRSQTAKGEINRYADTLLTLFPIIRLYNATRLTLNGYVNAINIWKNQTILMERKKAWLMSLSAVLSSIPLLLLFLVGGQMTINGVMTIGTLYIFLNLSGNVSGAMMNMPKYISNFRQFSTNAKRLSPYVLLDEGGD